MKPFSGCRYLIGVKPRKRSLKPVKASNKGDQEFFDAADAVKRC